MGGPSYQWNANDYAKSSGVQQQWARELIRKLRLKGSEHILDIGCGDGKATAEIAGSLPEGSVTGIDSSEPMIALAQSRYPSDAFPHLRFQHGDASSLKFENEFDIVFSNAALHWILDQRPVVHGIRRSLKPGGKILLQMGGRGNAAEVIAALDKLIEESEWKGYFHRFTFPYGFYDSEEYGIWLRESGFDEIRSELIPKDAVHHDRAAFESWIRTTWLPFTQRVPEEKREIFISSIADHYIRKHPMDDHGMVHVRMMRLEVEAVKR
ncbi:MAG: methyltransferase domain-containing protein [Ignavibacteriae bacterium]|nr:MAG: methyltransferase domain-containing protein [Ignavibacteriota bacterium]